MEGRRFRRFGMPRRNPQTHSPNLLPTHTHTPSASTISCCYCDYKFWAFNDPLFHLGRNHSLPLKAWFSVGVGFGLTALLAASLLLIFELGRALTLFPNHLLLDTFLSSVSANPLNDAVYVVVATLVSVSVHEFGHALAAASEGIRMEYVAVFVACIFPGALVAFNDDVMQALPCFTALRVYCAGIWHNAVCCAVCGLALLLLPVLLFPFYIHGESPMVLGVPSTSPLSGYLSRGDVIVSVDGVPIRNAQEWMDMAAFLNELSLNDGNHNVDVQSVGTVSNRKGYCVPNPMMEESKQMLILDNQYSCPDGLTSFTTVPCAYTSINIEKTYCLNAKDVVKLNKCGDGWPPTITNGSNCICSQDESCLSPIQIPGLIWVEVTYSRPYSLECLRVRRKSFADSRYSDSMESNCGGTFVFVGNVISMARSVQLTAYRPRWAFPLGTYLPNVLERILRCTFQVSLTLALLNSLPVYLLDGESILEASLLHFTLLSPRKRRTVVQVCLFGGTVISILAFLRIVLYGL
ncbi:putative S2P endopeptidase [Rosa chinensis]|uniref:Endopeptidase S2P n=2 Tax=Rosa chinensis TaxID=74649 RepID=A0A2P6Q7T8_ROSCH|nr:membrane-bound transcription factor site-2 protease homolog isoform X1 [Rosa chinensis]XP_040363069.1 membrane-bound transcription factor site-2 protease homolog isoform X1 [Rosa chinensis]PRQ30241.1 putative S2P endopeptidase [Rosa chinensis]